MKILPYTTVPTITVHKKNYLWPKVWGEHKNTVYNQQCFLAYTAKMWGIKNIFTQKLQLKLINSDSFRFLAIHQVTSLFSKTYPIRISDKEKCVIEETIKKLTELELKPIKWIKTLTQEIAIIQLKDLIVQHLVKFITEPILEIYADIHNFGGRRNRSAHQALFFLEKKMRIFTKPSLNQFNNIGLNGFFKTVWKSWINAQFPLPKEFLRFLQCWSNQSVTLNESKVIKQLLRIDGIFPLLLNFTLDGLELFITQQNWIKALKKVCKIVYIRYLNKIMLIGPSYSIINKNLLPILSFTQRRGLHCEVTSAVMQNHNSTSPVIIFLGYRLIIHLSAHLFNSTFILIPLKSSFVEICYKLRSIFHFNIHKSASIVITKANALIISWCSYFCLGQSYRYRKSLTFYLFKLCWNWARRKHPRWGKNLIASQYFLNHDAIISPKRWLFKGKMLLNSTYSTKHQFIYLALPTNAAPRCYYPLLGNAQHQLRIHAFYGQRINLIRYFYRLKRIKV